MSESTPDIIASADTDLVRRARAAAAVATWHPMADLMRELADALERSAKLVDEHLERTADGRLLVETDELFCPKCGGEVRVVVDRAYCDDCPNPDSGNEPPLPLFLTWCYADQVAAKAAASKR